MKLSSEQIKQIVGYIAQATADILLRDDKSSLFASALKIIEILGLKSHVGEIMTGLLVSK